MRRKFLAVLIVVFAVLMLVFCVTACKDNGKVEFDPERITEMYINTDGELILVLDDGTRINCGSFSGEGSGTFDPEYIVDSYIDNNGNLIIVFKDGKEIQYGKIRDERTTYLYTEVREEDTVVGYALRGLLAESSLDIVIPSSFRGLPVVEIMDGAFYMNDRIVSVTIPDTVKKIGAWAFEECTALKNVDFGNGVTEIGISAFCGCTSLTKIALPDSIRIIDESAFTLCSSVTEVTLNLNGVLEVIGDAAFAGCSKIESFIMPDSVTYMGWGAFMQCTSLKLMALSNNLTEIDDYAFSECTKLSTLTFGVDSKVTRIGRAAFDRCAIEEVVIPAYVYEIGATAFYKCTKLKKVTLNDSLLKLGDGVFSGCKVLEEITIPFFVNYIGVEAFKDCSKLKSVTFENPDNWKVYSDPDGIGVAISNLQLSNSSFASDYLTGTHVSRYWKRG